MIRIIEIKDHTLSLERTIRGSIDCYYSTSYSEANSLNLAKLAAIAYDDEREIKAFLNSASISRESTIFRHAIINNPISKFSYFEHKEKLSNIDTQGFTFEDPENFYIAFRGTQEIRDWLTDLDGISIKSSFCHGNVHGGFHAALNAVLPKLKKILDVRDKSKNVVICGHSLGGALATLCSAWVRDKYTSRVMLYTYGSPRVGCKDFVDYYSNINSFPAFRIANPTDLIPSVPWDTASRDTRRIEYAAMVRLCPYGWIVGVPGLAHGEVHENSNLMRYKHFGCPISLRPEGFTIIGNPLHMDGEFASGVQKDWQSMPLFEFIKSRMNNINHHFMTEYLGRLRRDFKSDCTNWAHGNPKPYQTKQLEVEKKFVEVEEQLRIANYERLTARHIAQASTTRVSTTIPDYRAQNSASPEERVRTLEIYHATLKSQIALLNTRINETSTEGRKRSLERITKRPFDGYLEEELLRHA